MTYLSLRWRIQIVMGVTCMALLGVLVYGRDSLPVGLNQTTIGLMVCAAFLISVVIGIGWHWYSIEAEK